MIKSVLVIGSGAMGSGIAQLSAANGHATLLYDVSVEALEKAKVELDKLCQKQVDRGKWTQEYVDNLVNNLTYTTDLADADSVDLAIEAIVENIDIKKKVFGDLEARVGESCILASNTSSLSVTAIAQSCKLPQRCLGLHFFNPAPVMKLVEVVPGIQTSEDSVNKCKVLMEAWGKTAVVVKDTPGFIVNRVARPFYGEALRIYEEGIATKEEIDSILLDGGYRMGPFQLMDYIGHDVNYKVTSSVWESFYYDERYKPSLTQKALVDAGYFGRKSGKGFYDYPSEFTKVSYPEELTHKVLYRINLMLINEAADAVFWNIATPQAIEIAMTKGVNYPHGLLGLANKVGIKQCVSMLDALYERYREPRYRCSPLLRDMAESGAIFQV